ncbi:MAG: DNA-binding transcriptional regulator Fis [Gammaproteobacteria bacterium]|nr:DNA-binding transcriptional regulator Fis [Gammaproteobacteria bacterium]
MKQQSTIPLCKCVELSLQQYFKDMNGEQPSDLYNMVLSQIEKPLLQAVMLQAQSNQTRAAKMLGINRNTLRKKLKQYGLE